MDDDAELMSAESRVRSLVQHLPDGLREPALRAVDRADDPPAVAALLITDLGCALDPEGCPPGLVDALWACLSRQDMERAAWAVKSMTTSKAFKEMLVARMIDTGEITVADVTAAAVQELVELTASITGPLTR